MVRQPLAVDGAAVQTKRALLVVLAVAAGQMDRQAARGQPFKGHLVATRGRTSVAAVVARLSRGLAKQAVPVFQTPSPVHQ